MTPLVVLAALAAVVIWGASPVATKLAVTDIPPFGVMALRAMLSAMVAVPVALAMGVKLPPTWRQRGVLALSGLCVFVAFPLIFATGLARTSANHASMILACLPLFTGAIAFLWDRRLPGALWWPGCALALLGEGLLIGLDVRGAQGATLEGDLICFVANGFVSLGYVAGARLQREGYASTGTTFWGVALPALLLLPTLPWLLDDIAVEEVGAMAWGGLLYLALIVTVVGYVLWYGALGRGGIARMGLFQFFQPVTGVIAAAILLGEAVTWGFAGASAIILAGVWVALKAR